MEWSRTITLNCIYCALAFSAAVGGPARCQTPVTSPSYTFPELPSESLPTVNSELNFYDYVDNTAAKEVSLDNAAGLAAMLTQPWWSTANARPIVADTPAQAWELDQLIWMAVENSPFVQAVLIEPQILQAQATATNGQFDPNAFVESIFRDTSDPVGNTLTTGSANRLNDHVWNNSSGVRSKNTRGGLAELAQDFNFKDSNSTFFVPENQADSRMVLRYTQPLLRGAGQSYNRSSYLVASLAANESMQEASKQIQKHAFDITSTYWELVAARASFKQLERGLKNLEELRDQLAGRDDIDLLRSQLLRSEASISRQRSLQAKAYAHMRSAEAGLRSAVAAPELIENSHAELLPATQSSDWKSQVSREEELTSALSYNPEVQAIRVSLKASRVRLQVAENELRPTLNLVMEGYVRGLNGDFDAAKSFGDQFSKGAPSYSAGVSYLRPYRNTAANAILRERRLELRRTLLELDHTLLSVGADVETAIVHLEAAFSELESAVQSTLATNAELDYLVARWKDAFMDNTQRGLLLEQTLNAEIQLTQAENTWARAQSDHMIALARLRLATGTLLPMVDPF